MSMLASLATADLTAYRDQVQRRYDALTTSDLARGKPSSDKLDLSNALLALRGDSDVAAADAWPRPAR